MDNSFLLNRKSEPYRPISENPTMIYKFGGDEEIYDPKLRRKIPYSYEIVDVSEVQDYLATGEWFTSILEALEAEGQKIEDVKVKKTKTEKADNGLDEKTIN